MTRFYLQTYGCQMNVYESGVVRRVLADADLVETADEREADVLLMLTCSVRSHAEQRALGRLGTFRALRSARPGRVIGVLGCMAQRLAGVLIGEYQVDVVCGPDEYLRLPELIQQAQAGVRGLAATGQTGECYDRVMPQRNRGRESSPTARGGRASQSARYQESKCPEDGKQQDPDDLGKEARDGNTVGQTTILHPCSTDRGNRGLESSPTEPGNRGLESSPTDPVSAYVSVSRGCDNHCAYCVVPQVRGKERSRPGASIQAEAQALAAAGVKDITLLGQNVLAYRDGEHRFPALLSRIATHLPDVRIRFLTCHPRDLGEDLLEVMHRLPNVCPSLHLPVQSGSNAILKRMERGYTREQYLHRIALCRRFLPEVCLSTDVLVGFPSETEEDFQATLDLVEDVRFDFAYMFRYSARPGTAAARFEPKVTEADAGRRLARLIEVQGRITLERSRELLGQELELLIERPTPRGNGWLGRTTTNRVVVLRGRAQAGDLVRGRVTQLKGRTPVADVQARVPVASCLC